MAGDNLKSAARVRLRHSHLPSAKDGSSKQSAADVFARSIDGFNDLLKTHAIHKAKRDKYRRAVKGLSKLTNVELGDIGICRGDIHNMARGDRTITRGVEVNIRPKGFV